MFALKLDLRVQCTRICLVLIFCDFLPAGLMDRSTGNKLTVKILSVKMLHSLLIFIERAVLTPM